MIKLRRKQILIILDVVFLGAPLLIASWLERRTDCYVVNINQFKKGLPQTCGSMQDRIAKTIPVYLCDWQKNAGWYALILLIKLLFFWSTKNVVKRGALMLIMSLKN